MEQKKGNLCFNGTPGLANTNFGRAQTVSGLATSGRGELYSYTITHVPTPGFEAKAPYVIGLVELDEGVRMIANLVNVTPDEISIGMRLKVAWEKLNDDITYFAFEPDKSRRRKTASKR